jgi:hypothetical protein
MQAEDIEEQPLVTEASAKVPSLPSSASRKGGEKSRLERLIHDSNKRRTRHQREVFNYAGAQTTKAVVQPTPETVPVVSAYERRKKDGDITAGIMSPPLEGKGTPRDAKGPDEEKAINEVGNRYSNFAMTTRTAAGKEAFFNSTVNISKSVKR